MPAARSSATSAGIHQREAPPRLRYDAASLRSPAPAARSTCRRRPRAAPGAGRPRTPLTSNSGRGDPLRVHARTPGRPWPAPTGSPRGATGSERSRARPPLRSASRPGTAAGRRATPRRRSRARTGRSPRRHARRVPAPATRYPAVPRIVPACVNDSMPDAVAIPKSATWTFPRPSRIRLPGLTSRWTTPASCAASSAEAASSSQPSTWRRRARARRALLEAAAREVLHHDQRAPVVLVDVEDRDDVGVAREASGRERLALEALPQPVVLRIALGQHLDRDVTTELLVGGAEDLAHAAAPDVLGVAVTGRKGVGRDGHARLGNRGVPHSAGWKRSVNPGRGVEGLGYRGPHARGRQGSFRPPARRRLLFSSRQAAFPRCLRRARARSGRTTDDDLDDSSRALLRACSSCVGTAGGTGSASASGAPTATRSTAGRTTGSSATTTRARRSARRRSRLSACCWSRARRRRSTRSSPGPRPTRRAARWRSPRARSS